MSLNLYLRPEDCPVKIIDSNDAYFDLYTKLKNTSLIQYILQNVDDAKYCTSSSFTSAGYGGISVPISCLSTGTKTLLNIIEHPDECFSLSECGQNALRVLPVIKDGNAFCPDLGVALRENSDCDILCDGIRYTKFLDLLNYVRYQAN